MQRELQAQKADTQSEIDEWVRIFNFERPHQALQGDTPAEHYHKGSRKYKGSQIEINYGKMPTRIIDSHGDLKWHGVDYFLSEALGDERVGMAKIGEEHYEVWFDVLLLGILDEGKRVFYPRRGTFNGGEERTRNFTYGRNSAIRGAAKVLPMWVNYHPAVPPPLKVANTTSVSKRVRIPIIVTTRLLSMKI